MFGKGSRKLETIVGDGTRVVGQVNVKGTIRIDGIVEGDLHADWVVVGETGKAEEIVNASKEATADVILLDLLAVVQLRQ